MNFTKNTNSTSTTNNSLDDSEVALCMFNILCGVLATFANITLIIIIWKKGHQRTLFDLIVWSLAVTNVIASLSQTLLVLVVTLALMRRLHKRYAFNAVDNFNGLFIYFYTSSLLHVLAITVQRLCLIFFPIRFRQIATRACIKGIIAFVWILNVFLWLIRQFLYHLFAEFLIIITGAVVAVMYAMIAVKICFLLKEKKFHWNKEQRVLLNALAVTVIFIACLFPIAIDNIIGGDNPAHAMIYLSLSALRFFADPLCYFFLSYWLGKRDDRKRARREAAQATLPDTKI